MCYSNCPFERAYGPNKGECSNHRGYRHPEAHCYAGEDEEGEESK